MRIDGERKLHELRLMLASLCYRAQAEGTERAWENFSSGIIQWWLDNRDSEDLDIPKIWRHLPGKNVEAFLMQSVAPRTLITVEERKRIRDARFQLLKKKEALRVPMVGQVERE